MTETISRRVTRRTLISERNKPVANGIAPLNPLKQARHRLGLTVQGCADKIGISKQALIRLEQGTYDQILPSVLTWFVNTHGYSELSLVDGYEDFQARQRLRHRQYFGPDLNVSLELHPLRELRERVNVTPTEVAKALCLPQATLTYFERRPRQQKSIPKGLINVLHEIGYSTPQINEFRRNYELYRAQLSGEGL